MKIDRNLAKCSLNEKWQIAHSITSNVHTNDFAPKLISRICLNSNSIIISIDNGASRIAARNAKHLFVCNLLQMANFHLFIFFALFWTWFHISKSENSQSYFWPGLDSSLRCYMYIMSYSNRTIAKICLNRKNLSQ